jgi:hypothetical protein
MADTEAAAANDKKGLCSECGSCSGPMIQVPREFANALRTSAGDPDYDAELLDRLEAIADSAEALPVSERAAHIQPQLDRLVFERRMAALALKSDN